MTRTLLASRYARALFELAVEKGVADQLEAEMNWVTELLQSQEFVSFFFHPKVEKEAKKRLINKTLSNAHPVLLDFLSMLVDKRRERAFTQISAEYASMVASRRGEIRAIVTSAVALTPAELAAIKQKFGSAEASVVLEEKLDPAILGGLIVRIGNKIYDGSVAARVRRMRRQLTEAQVGLQR